MGKERAEAQTWAYSLLAWNTLIPAGSRGSGRCSAGRRGLLGSAVRETWGVLVLWSSDRTGFASTHRGIINKSIVRLERVLKYAISLYRKNINQKGKVF